jgi:hypothetical protein
MICHHGVATGQQLCFERCIPKHEHHMVQWLIEGLVWIVIDAKELSKLGTSGSIWWHSYNW